MATDSQAQIKPNYFPRPGAAGNTVGMVGPNPSPAPPDTPAKPATEPETAAEKNFMEKFKDGIDNWIDAQVEGSGFSQPAMVLGAAAKAVNEVFMPTQLWELLPIGKLGKVKKVAEAAGIVKKAEKTAEIGKDAKKAAGKGGGRVEGLKRRPQQPNKKKWKEKGGTVEEHADGSTTFTRKDGQSVTYDKEGFADFSKYSEAEVKIEGLTGKYGIDEKMANKAVGLDKTPEGYVWHHVEDGKTLQLLSKDIHGSFPHTGGSAVIRGGL